MSADEKARAEAERRYPREAPMLSFSEAREDAATRHGFAEGAAWQRSKSVEVTEELKVLRSQVAAVKRLCDETDIETHEATQAWLVGNIRAALTPEAGPIDN